MSQRTSLLARLAEGPMVGDGAMGTHLHELGFDIRQGPEALVLSDPDAIRRVHAAYIEAGAELLETNTFGANALSLAAGGHETRVREINAAAARLALAAAGGRAWVAGAIGPVALLPHDEAWDEARVRAAYREQVQALCEGGVQGLLLETFDDLESLLLALDECGSVAGGRVPLIAQMVFADGLEASGASAADAARRLIGAGAAVVGANCGRGLQAIRQAVEGLLAGSAGQAFVSAYPNAGYPERIGGRTIYLATPAYIAAQAAEWVGQGVRLVGGCCGTTPETIRAIRNALAAMRRLPRAAASAVGPARAPVEAAATPVDRMAGGFLESIRDVRWPVIAEIDPPPHLDWRPVADGARALLEGGAQAISLAENPLASIRMDNFFLGAQIRRETGGQVISHVTCRDRNSIGLQSALMAAHAGGIEAVLAVTGDPAGRGGHQRVVSVYELTSLGLVRLAAGLNRGRTTTGRDLRGATRFSIGVAYNSAAANPAAETARLRRKQAEGAVFVMTQPVFDRDHARRVLEQTRLDGLRVFLGFLPPVTWKLARYLHHEVPGIRLPEELLARLASFDQPADQERAALEQTGALMESLAGELDGIYLITPGARWPCLMPLLARVKALRA
jgi:homocysteine S-methyltransferase